VEQTPRQPARIAVDLGIENLDNTNAAGRTGRWTPLRGKKPDFCALFAADGLRQLDAYLTKWAAYDDYIARRPHFSAGGRPASSGTQS
jgi:hypothetical protein